MQVQRAWAGEPPARTDCLEVSPKNLAVCENADQHHHQERHGSLEARAQKRQRLADSEELQTPDHSQPCSSANTTSHQPASPAAVAGGSPEARQEGPPNAGQDTAARTSVNLKEQDSATSHGTLACAAWGAQPRTQGDVAIASRVADAQQPAQHNTPQAAIQPPAKQVAPQRRIGGYTSTASATEEERLRCQAELATTRLLRGGSPTIIPQSAFLEAIRDGQEALELFDFRWPRERQASRTSSILSLTQRQHGIMYALAGCADVMYVMSRVKPEVRDTLHRLYGIDKINFYTWFKNRRLPLRRLLDRHAARQALAAKGEPAPAAARTTIVLNTAIDAGGVGSGGPAGSNAGAGNGANAAGGSGVTGAATGLAPGHGSRQQHAPMQPNTSRVAQQASRAATLTTGVAATTNAGAGAVPAMRGLRGAEPLDSAAPLHGNRVSSPGAPASKPMLVLAQGPGRIVPVQQQQQQQQRQQARTGDKASLQGELATAAAAAASGGAAPSGLRMAGNKVGVLLLSQGSGGDAGVGHGHASTQGGLRQGQVLAVRSSSGDSSNGDGGAGDGEGCGSGNKGSGGDGRQYVRLQVGQVLPPGLSLGNVEQLQTGGGGSPGTLFRLLGTGDAAGMSMGGGNAARDAMLEHLLAAGEGGAMRGGGGGGRPGIAVASLDRLVSGATSLDRLMPHNLIGGLRASQVLSSDAQAGAPVAPIERLAGSLHGLQDSAPMMSANRQLPAGLQGDIAVERLLAAGLHQSSGSGGFMLDRLTELGLQGLGSFDRLIPSSAHSTTNTTLEGLIGGGGGGSMLPGTAMLAPQITLLAPPQQQLAQQQHHQLCIPTSDGQVHLVSLPLRSGHHAEGQLMQVQLPGQQQQLQLQAVGQGQVSQLGQQHLQQLGVAGQPMLQQLGPISLQQLQQLQQPGQPSLQQLQLQQLQHLQHLQQLDQLQQPRLVLQSTAPHSQLLARRVGLVQGPGLAPLSEQLGTGAASLQQLLQQHQAVQLLGGTGSQTFALQQLQQPVLYSAPNLVPSGLFMPVPGSSAGGAVAVCKHEV